MSAGAARAQVLLLSTGVIGRRIKLDALLGSLPQLAGSLGAGAEDAHHAAVAVTTTDLVSKSAALEVGRSGQAGRVVGLVNKESRVGYMGRIYLVHRVYCVD